MNYLLLLLLLLSLLLQTDELNDVSFEVILPSIRRQSDKKKTDVNLLSTITKTKKGVYSLEKRK